MSTITQLKHHLGKGLGLRKNRFMIEIPVPNIDGQTLNVLCKNASFPERTIMSQLIWHKGREYDVRGETNYGSEFELTFLDNDKMDIRRLFDTWLTKIDNTNPPNTGILGASFESIAPGLLDTLTAGVETASIIKNVIQNPNLLLDFVIGQFDPSRTLSTAAYQTDVNIWQVNHANTPIYGYKMQNSFPKKLGTVAYSSEDQNTLTEFTVTFAFSEFVPIHKVDEDITRVIFGDQATDLVRNIDQLF